MPDWQELAERYLMHTAHRTPVTIVRGQGSRVFDDRNREYLDMVGGWAVTSLGHSHPAVVEAITKQAGVLMQTSNQFYTVPQVELAKLLVENSCGDRVFFSNSGTEAVEGAIKLARKWGKLHRNGAYEVISAANSFHGRTLAALAATGQPRYQEPFTPMPEGFMQVPYDNPAAIMEATTDHTCAVLLEPLQGEGGVIVPDDDYLQQVRRWCDQQNLLLILDEVQTGVGRTGTLWAYEQAGIEPDVITIAKGLGNGFPIGAIIAKESAAVFEPGDHGSTFGGNPLACAAALAVVNYILENDVLSNVRACGEQLRKGLLEMKRTYFFVNDARGRGLLQALDFQLDLSDTIIQAAIEEGLLLNAPRPNVIRFMPALTITPRQITFALDALERILVWLDNASTSTD